ncbi:ABC transporter permease [Alkaliphilus crotonatoxidans]
MTLREIAFKNIKGNFNKYLMYLLSNTLVVMVFFIFANFIFNPEIASVESMGTRGALAARAMLLCEYVIIIFSLFFTSYSISSFLKSREKEFGLLSLFGLTKGQIRSFVIYENLIISSISIVSGLLLGILFSRLFFMAVSAILYFDSATPFIISTKAIVVTAVAFLVLFQGVSFIAALRIKNSNIAGLLKGARVPKKEPNFSVFKAILAILFIAIGYGMAFFSGVAIFFTMFPILFFTVTGTYFLFSQFSVFFSKRLKKNEGLYYNGINMLTLSQIIYKIKDNATILFIVAVLGAVTLTASATVYSYQQSLKVGLEKNYPQNISYVEVGEDTHEVLPAGTVERVLEAHGHELDFYNRTLMIPAQNAREMSQEEMTEANQQYALSNFNDFYLISNSEYNRLAEKYGRKQVELQAGEVFVNSYHFVIGEYVETFQEEELTLRVKEEEIPFRLAGQINGSVLNADLSNTNVAVISDQDFDRLISQIPQQERLVYYGYNIKNWQRAEAAVVEIASMVSEGSNSFQQQITDFVAIMQGAAILLFIGSFISILFFIATGSIIYFKMFNELYQDRQQFISLRRIGITNGETKKIISNQTFIIFFLPFLVSFIHSAFAIKTLSDLLFTNLTFYYLTIAGIYLGLQTLYYFFAKYMYVRQVKRILI